MLLKREEDEEGEERRRAKEQKRRRKEKKKVKELCSTLLMEAPNIYEAGPPCLSRAVDGFVRIGLAGVAWGAFMGSYDAMKEGHKGFSRAVYVPLLDYDKVSECRQLVNAIQYGLTKSVARNGLGWGCFAGAYFGLNCGVENMRGKRDWKNATTSGAITGALLSVRSGSVAKMLCTAALVSAIATSIDFKHPVQCLVMFDVFVEFALHLPAIPSNSTARNLQGLIDNADHR